MMYFVSAERLVPNPWLTKADGDLQFAQHFVADPESRISFRENIGFHCQQAAEKYLKALLTFAHVDFSPGSPTREHRTWECCWRSPSR